MTSDVVQYLTSKGLRITGTGPNIRTACVFCEGTKGRALSIYVGDTKSPGIFKCHHCGRTGDLRSIQRHFGDRP